MGHIGDIWDRVAHLDSITMKDVNRVAAYTFQESRCTVGVLCPKPHADILRPSMTHPDYPKNLFQENLTAEPAAVGIENVTKVGWQRRASGPPCPCWTARIGTPRPPRERPWHRDV